MYHKGLLRDAEQKAPTLGSEDLRLNSNSHISKLCFFGHVTYPFWIPGRVAENKMWEVPKSTLKVDLVNFNTLSVSATFPIKESELLTIIS
jgi:hypothetical protein